MLYGYTWGPLFVQPISFESLLALQDIELFIESARRKSLNAVVNVGSKGINMAANAMVTAAVSGQKVVSNHLRSRSAVDLKSLRDNDQLYKEHTSGSKTHSFLICFDV